MTEKLLNSIIRQKALPAPDEQEENIIRAVGTAVAQGGGLNIDLRYFASWVGSPNERTLRELVVGLQRKGLLTGFQNALMIGAGEVNQLQLGLSPDGFRKFRELESSSRRGSSVNRAELFLTHAAFDKSLALLLKDEIERRLPGTKVFCSSDPTDLPPGTKWSPEIQGALQRSRVLLLLASERGLQRPWVWFECGTFWFSGREIIPLCFGSIAKNALPPPLSELQATRGDEPGDLKILLERIASVTGAEVGAGSTLDGLAQELKKFDKQIVETTMASSGWQGVVWKDKFLAYDGPYESLAVIEDALFEMSMQKALEAGGYRIALYDENNFRNIGESGRFVQLTDRRTFRRRIANGAMWLIARPDNAAR